MNLTAAYKEARKPRFSPYGDRRMFPTTAQSALQQARYRIQAEGIKAKFQAMEEHTVRITSHPDDDSYYEDLEGDMFNPDVNTDINPSILEREQNEFRARVERDGVWSYSSEYWNGEEWEHADSISGFVGDDFNDSGYDTDLMQAALEGYEGVKLCPTCGRPDK